VAKQELSVNVSEDRRAGVAIPAPLIRRPVPKPGDRLRRAVDAALAELAATAAPDDPTRHKLDDLLVGGLAWAAATGDTCRIEPAVHDVRTARVRLDAADPDGARTALLAARQGLEPSRRTAR
jgi:hypothetical protein